VVTTLPLESSTLTVAANAEPDTELDGGWAVKTSFVGVGAVDWLTEHSVTSLSTGDVEVFDVAKDA
jgi:hypothetical protein